MTDEPDKPEDDEEDLMDLESPADEQDAVAGGAKCSRTCLETCYDRTCARTG
jgi:hypothetical protein